MKKSEIIALLSFFALCMHVVVIAEDVQTILRDPNEANKPGEILKTAFDITRYLK